MSPAEVPDALVEKAARARWEALGSVFTGYNGDVARTWDALAALFPAEAEQRRTNERHVLAAVLPEIQAQALRDASTQVLVLGTWSGTSIHVGERAAKWLRDRATRMTATTECCDHEAMEYGNCSDCMNTGHVHDPNKPCPPPAEESK